jgi:CRP-like cAMP-binding protein
MLRKLPNDIQALGRTFRFRDLSKRELHAVQRLGTVIDRGAGEVICRLDQSSRQVAVIVCGEVAATTADGRRRRLHDGDCFGSLSSSGQQVEPEEVETVTPVSLFVVGRREYAALRYECPRLAARLAGVHDATPAPLPTRAETWPAHALRVTT